MCLVRVVWSITDVGSLDTWSAISGLCGWQLDYIMYILYSLNTWIIDSKAVYPLFGENLMCFSSHSNMSSHKREHISLDDILHVKRLVSVLPWLWCTAYNNVQQCVIKGYLHNVTFSTGYKLITHGVLCNNLNINKNLEAYNSLPVRSTEEELSL